MNYKNLIVAVLTPLVSAGVKFVLDYLGVPLDEGTFNAIVAAVVGMLLSAFGLDVLATKYPSLK